MTNEIIDLTGDNSDDDHESVTKENAVLQLVTEVTEFTADDNSEQKLTSKQTATTSEDNTNQEVLVPIVHKTKIWEHVVDAQSAVLTPKRGASTMSDILTPNKKTCKSLISIKFV